MKPGIGFKDLSQAFIKNIKQINQNPRGQTNIDSRLKDGQISLNLLKNANINRLCDKLTKMTDVKLVVKTGAGDKIPALDSFLFTVKANFNAKKILTDEEKQAFEIIKPIALIEDKSANSSYCIMPEIEGENLADINHERSLLDFETKTPVALEKIEELNNSIKLFESFLKQFGVTEDALLKFLEEYEAEGYVGKSNQKIKCFKDILENRAKRHGINLNLGVDCREANLMINVANGKITLFDLIEDYWDDRDYRS